MRSYVRGAADERGAVEPEAEKLLEQYGCGPIQFTGTGDAPYERHLMFDNALDGAALGARERYEAAARSVRDVLSQRWLRTEQTYECENPKRVYYLSMEFLIGRSLANNVTNLLLDPLVRRDVDRKRIDWIGLLREEPDAGLGNGGLGRLAACFLDSMATLQLPAMGYGLRYEYGIFRQTIRDGWQIEQPDNWLRRPDPWEVVRPQEQVEVRLGCSFEVRGGSLGVIVGRPSSLLGIPFDRAVVLDLRHIPDLGTIDTADLEGAERKAGVAIEDHIVLLNTGLHARHYPNEAVMHTNPGLSPEATHWLADRGSRLHGVEGPSTDRPDDSTFPSHRVCRDRSLAHYEWLCNLEELLGKGEFHFEGFPLKFKKGSGSPVRALAFLD